MGGAFSSSKSCATLTQQGAMCYEGFRVYMPNAGLQFLSDCENLESCQDCTDFCLTHCAEWMQLFLMRFPPTVYLRRRGTATAPPWVTTWPVDNVLVEIVNPTDASNNMAISLQRDEFTEFSSFAPNWWNPSPTPTNPEAGSWVPARTPVQISALVNRVCQNLQDRNSPHEILITVSYGDTLRPKDDELESITRAVWSSLQQRNPNEPPDVVLEAPANSPMRSLWFEKKGVREFDPKNLLIVDRFPAIGIVPISLALGGPSTPVTAAPGVPFAPPSSPSVPTPPSAPPSPSTPASLRTLSQQPLPGESEPETGIPMAPPMEETAYSL